MSEVDAARPRRLRALVPLIGIFAIATLLAAVRSADVSFWTDESITISAAERTWPELWRLLNRIDAVHGLYYSFMKLWVEAFGASPFALRLPSALAVGGAAAGVYLIGRRLASPGTALVAGLLAATLPRLTWAGIEGRPFAISALLAVWATYLFVRALGTPRRWGWWIGYGAVAALGVAENIYLALLVAAHGVTVLIGYRRAGRVWAGYLSAAAFAALASLPILLMVRSQQGQLGVLGDRDPLSILRKILVNQFFLGETPSSDAAAEWFTRAWQVSGIVAAAIGLALMLAAVLLPSRHGDDKRSLLALLVPWVVLPTVVVAGYSVLIAPLYQPRYFTFAAPAAALLIALGLRSLGRRWYALAAVALYGVAVTVVFTSQRIPFAKSGSDWSASSAVVDSAAESGDAVYFAPREASSGLSQYTARRIAVAYPGAFEGLEDLTLVSTGAETGTFDGYSSQLAGSGHLDEHDRVWMVYLVSTSPDVINADREVFETEGFEGETRWSGPRSVVVEYTRD